MSNDAYQKFIRVCLKESFQREKKDLEKPLLFFMLTDLPLGVDYTERRKTKRKRRKKVRIKIY
jgi:hypothetical protein